MNRKTPKEIRAEKIETSILKKGIDKILEIASPFYAPVRDMLVTAWTNTRKTFFDEFLIGIEAALSGADEKEKAKIYKKFGNKQNDIWLGEIVNSVMFSKCTKSRVILGFIAAKYLCGKTIDYIDAIIIAALRELMDDEIDLFTEICKHVGTVGTDLTELAVGDKVLMIQRLDRLNIIKRETMYVDYEGTKPRTKIEPSVSFPAAIETKVTSRLKEYISKTEKNNSHH